MSTPIYESYRPDSRRSTEVVTDPETGLPLIIHTQDTRPVVESAKRAASNYDRHAPNKHGWQRVASIPLVVWRQLQRTGVAKDEKALNRWLNERDNRVFRTDDARRL